MNPRPIVVIALSLPAAAEHTVDTSKVASLPSPVDSTRFPSSPLAPHADPTWSFLHENERRPRNRSERREREREKKRLRRAFYKCALPVPPDLLPAR